MVTARLHPADRTVNILVRRVWGAYVCDDRVEIDDRNLARRHDGRRRLVQAHHDTVAAVRRRRALLKKM